MTQSLNDVLDRLHGAIEAHRRFAADASHELRAPISAMAGEIDVALKHRRTADEYRDTLLIVGERLSALTSLCKDLMLLVHAQEGAQGIELREVPVWRAAGGRRVPAGRPTCQRARSRSPPASFRT